MKKKLILIAVVTLFLPFSAVAAPRDVSDYKSFLRYVIKFQSHEESKVFDGKEGSDTLIMRMNSNRRNTIIGGGGKDVFAFVPVNALQNGYTINAIQDFKAGEDSINVSGFFKDMGNWQKSAFQVGDDVAFFLNDTNLVIIRNAKLTDLKAEDFVFGEKTTLAANLERLESLHLNEECVKVEQGHEWCS